MVQIANEFEMPCRSRPSDHQQSMAALCRVVSTKQDVESKAFHPEPLGCLQVVTWACDAQVTAGVGLHGAILVGILSPRAASGDGRTADPSWLVLDWANAAAGDPLLDRARSWAILNLDPAARARQDLPGWQALTRGWAESAGLDTIPGWARAWACRFMLTDLAARYSPSDLTHVREALRHAGAA